MFDQYEIQRRIDEFSSRHGSSVMVDGWVYYADGATRDGNSLGPMNEPPRDAVLRCRNIVKYRQTILDRKVREFDELKCQLKEDTCGWTDEEKNVRRLERHRRLIRLRRKQLKDAKQDLRRAMTGPSPEQERISQQAIADTEAARHRYRNKLDGIHI